MGMRSRAGDAGPDLDVACANLAGDSVSVLRSRGGAGGGWNGLGDLQTFAVGNGPLDLVVVDLDLDGRSDVATANFYNKGPSGKIL